MTNNKEKQINIRTPEREAAMIRRNAEKCGMSVSRFLILRGLGYEPQPMSPAAYYHFMEKLDSLHDYAIPPELDRQISALADDIRKTMVEMRREDLEKWLSQEHQLEKKAREKYTERGKHDRYKR